MRSTFLMIKIILLIIVYSRSGYNILKYLFIFKYLFVPKYLFVCYLLSVSSLYRRTAIVFYRRTATLYRRTVANNIKC